MLRRLLKKYAINLAGLLYNIGNTVQLIMGMVLFSPQQIASSLLFYLADLCLMFAGQKKYGVPLNCILAFFGIVLAAWPGLVALEAGTLFGVVASIPSFMFGIFSNQLKKKYVKSRSGYIRETFGRPRRCMGLAALLLCRLPIMMENAMHARWNSFTIFLIWAAADIVASLSDKD